MLMADPMLALRSLQKLADESPPIEPADLDHGYLKMYDEPNGGKRFSFAKISGREVQALSIFGFVEPIDSVQCYSVGYAVNERHRGRGLAVEAANRGIDELKKKFAQEGIVRFYVEAVVEVTNTHSIRVAEKLFSEPAERITDHDSGRPAFYFKKLINVR